jgi:hypothetical protein
VRVSEREREGEAKKRKNERNFNFLFNLEPPIQRAVAVSLTA